MEPTGHTSRRGCHVSPGGPATWQAAVSSAHHTLSRSALGCSEGPRLRSVYYIRTAGRRLASLPLPYLYGAAVSASYSPRHKQRDSKAVYTPMTHQRYHACLQGSLGPKLPCQSCGLATSLTPFVAPNARSKTTVRQLPRYVTLRASNRTASEPGPDPNADRPAASAW